MWSRYRGGLDSGAMAKANLEKNPLDVAGMFDEVGKNYDITNTVMTGGLDRYWRKRTRQRLDLKPGEKVLDLAAGTAVSTVELTKSGAWCVACDFSQGMLAAGKHRDVPKVVGDAMHLPFADETFDAVTISYGLRNVHDFEAGLREMARVTKPGGRLVVNEFSTPVVPVTPGAKAATGRKPENSSGRFSTRCRVMRRRSVVFGPMASGVICRLPRPATKTGPVSGRPGSWPNRAATARAARSSSSRPWGRAGNSKVRYVPTGLPRASAPVSSRMSTRVRG